MDPEQKETKCKEGNVSKMKWFFEIKRPRKPTSSTLPRTKSKQADTNSNDVSRERMFTRNESRRTSSRKNKYKREVAKEAKEKVPENNNRVKQLCQKFADIETSSSTPNTNLYRSLSEETVRIPTKSEMSITELREQYKKVDVKRRNIYEKNHKEQREQKTRSFADAMTDEETKNTVGAS
ncbi:hypothetical protein JTB14_014588 [Gonioctena quinquepunctata]|nr:hypothetical protein JTB14_014588 [Gonioctena quinquepunctata]